MAVRKHDSEIIAIAEGRASSLGKASNRNISWEQFYKMLSNVSRTGETQKAYLALLKEEQDRLKSVSGWILGGPVDAGRRRRKLIEKRSLVTLDCDDMTPELLQEIKSGVNPICKYEFIAHTTRKHRPDKPRLRIYLLPEAPFDSDQYDAVSRILAEKIDPTMDSVDDVSFRSAQMMFKPTASRNQEYLIWQNPGEKVNTDDLLKSFRADWTDYRNLPYSEARGQRRRTSEKAENPLAKNGIVGAFCRAYTVEEAMEKFIPGIYLPGDDAGSKPRYSYAAGSTSNGVVVEDDGLFIYSHHGTDPCGEKLCNAFDMVRIHKFGDKDEDFDKEGKNPRDWPSFKEMAEFVTEDPLVKGQLLANRVDVEEMFEDISDEDDEAVEDLAAGGSTVDDEIAEILAAPRQSALPDLTSATRPAKPKKGWPQTELELDQNGQIKPSIHNIATILCNDPRMWSAIGLNQFTNKMAIRRSIKTKLPMVPKIEAEDPINGSEVTDTHDIAIKMILESPSGKGKSGWGLKVARSDVHDAMIAVGNRWAFHPVKEYLERIIWDGTPRIDHMVTEVLGCPADVPYYRDAIRLAMIASIARIYNPGHKWDHVPILSGAQGIRKSTFLRALYSFAWTGDLTAQMASDKDAVEQMLGMWALEMPELANMRRSESEDTKAFVTFQVDRVRLSYDRRMSTFKRQCVFWGTTNAEDYLKDPTGNRRFWPIEVTVDQIDTEWVESNRDQLWAEAVVLWRQMAVEAGDYRRIKLTLEGESLAEAERLQELHREEDATENLSAQIEEWADQTMPLSQFLSDTPEALAELDSFEGEPIVRRTVLSARMVAAEFVGLTKERLAANRATETSVGHSLSKMKGWVRHDQRMVMRGYGKLRVYTRIGATPLDIVNGYEIVGHTGLGSPPSIESDEDSIL